MEQHQLYLIGNKDKYGRLFLTGWKYNFLKGSYHCEYSPFIEKAYLFSPAMISDNAFLELIAGLMLVKGNELLTCDISLNKVQLKHTVKDGEYGGNTVD